MLIKTLWAYFRKPVEKPGTQFSMLPNTVLMAQLPVIRRMVHLEWLLRQQQNKKIHFYRSWTETDASLWPGFRYFYHFGFEALLVTLSLLFPIVSIQNTRFYECCCYVFKFLVTDFALDKLLLWNWTFEHWCDEIQMGVCFIPKESLLAFFTCSSEVKCPSLNGISNCP